MEVRVDSRTTSTSTSKIPRSDAGVHHVVVAIPVVEPTPSRSLDPVTYGAAHQNKVPPTSPEKSLVAGDEAPTFIPRRPPERTATTSRQSNNPFT